MPSKQKAKGSGFERHVAKYLTELYDENFERTIGSGAFIGRSNAARKDYLTESQTRSHKGDVTPPETFHYMNMECKFYKDFLFHQLFTNNCPVLNEWIEQTLEAADKEDINIIAMKFNRKGTYICVEDYDGLDKTNSMEYFYEGKPWYFYDMDAFYDLNKDSFKAICGSGHK